MNYDSYPDSYIAGILQEAKSFAMVGASVNTRRPKLLCAEISSRKRLSGFSDQSRSGRGRDPRPEDFCAPRRSGELVDVVNIFRNSEAALGIVHDAIALKDKLGVKVIWMQLGVRNDEGAALAEASGLQVVMKRCPKIEYGRLSGEIGWVGVNSRLISSRKPVMLGKGFQQLSIRQPKP